MRVSLRDDKVLPRGSLGVHFTDVLVSALANCFGVAQTDKADGSKNHGEEILSHLLLLEKFSEKRTRFRATSVPIEKSCKTYP